MGKSRFLHLMMVLTLVFTLLIGFLAAPLAVFAEDPSPTIIAKVPTLKVTCDVPSYTDDSGSTFTYSVNVAYDGSDTVIVNFSNTSPTDWNSTITYSGKEISSIPIGPEQYGSPDLKMLSISLAPTSGLKPDVGEYKSTFTASAGQLSQSIDLKAIIKAKYTFDVTTPDYKLNMKATAGKANNFTVNLENQGTAPLENISLRSSKPSDWTVTFSPDKVPSLAAGQTQQEVIIITPPKGKTVAGDYMITIYASNAEVSKNIEIRVTVDTPSIWGILSIIIIVVVIAGLAFLFLKLGRR
jgi:uncharacterized membrane protein